MPSYCIVPVQGEALAEPAQHLARVTDDVHLSLVQHVWVDHPHIDAAVEQLGVDAAAELGNDWLPIHLTVDK